MATLICQALVRLNTLVSASITLTVAHKKTGPGNPGPEKNKLNAHKTRGDKCASPFPKVTKLKYGRSLTNNVLIDVGEV